MMFQLGDGHWNETAQEQAASGRAANPNDGTSIFCHYIEDYLSGVGQMVEATSKQFIQPVSMFAFQANNYHYIVKSIRYSTGLSSMLSDKVIAKYEANTLRNRKALMAIWKSCLASFPAMGLGPAEKLDMFNRTFDDLCADIGAFSLPDPDLRGKLTQDTIESLIPQYSKFLEKNMDVLGSGGFRLKYSVSDIEKIIDVIFSSRK
ncbi:Exocyst complex component EXO70A1 [Zancudomyces culisetae]|nr:Exocyst complex component EXO70A1 [Zancudomyces culisetae]|eukprot:OMH81740.1 Exocyst complex component EXO70A1 [Zancudomyces culisetae]